MVGSRRRTTVVPWSDVVALRTEHRRLGRDRAVVDRADGSVVVLPADAPVEELERRRPGAPG